MEVTWNGDSQRTGLYFDDLEVNDAFRIDTHRSKGAVYIKIKSGRRHLEFYDIDRGEDSDFAQLELATGHVFMPTTSPVVGVNVQLHIDESKPCLYANV